MGNLVKVRLRADDLIRDACNLAISMINDEFFPTKIYSVKRGGDYIANPIIEVYKQIIDFDYGAIVARSYDTGINQRGKVQITGFTPSLNEITPHDRVLIVDDCADSRETIRNILDVIEAATSLKHDIDSPWDKKNLVYVVRDYKYFPENDDRRTMPDLYSRKWDMSDDSYWLIYPHEFDGLHEEEIREIHQVDMKKLRSSKP